MCGLSAAALPLACCQVEVPFGEVTAGAGDGVAAGVADAGGVGVGVGLAFACAAVTAPSVLGLCASPGCRVPPSPCTFAWLAAAGEGSGCAPPAAWPDP